MRNRTVALGIGSNLGNPLENLREAVRIIQEKFKIIRRSSIYESDALTPPNAPADWQKKFLNAVILIETDLNMNPTELLTFIKNVEAKMGRNVAEKWSPRIIDIDILYWSDADFKSEKLNIPHAELFNRPFALLPLLELWPRESLMQNRQIVWTDEWSEEIPFNTKRSKSFIWPQIMGIVNLTEDSFSDGGDLLKSDLLAAHLLKLRDEGTEIFDFGAESTRPGATGVTDDQEFLRLQRGLSCFAELGIKAKVSIDCRKPAVLHRLAEFFHFDIVNDVEGLSSKSMLDFVLRGGFSAVVMHSLGVPPVRDIVLSEDLNPVSQLNDWWAKKIEKLAEAGIDSSKIMMDPGIGFGKTKTQNLYILKNIEKLELHNTKLLLGYSRKSFFELFGSRQASERDVETALVTSSLVGKPVDVLRVHDAATQRAAWVGGGYFE